MAGGIVTYVADLCSDCEKDYPPAACHGRLQATHAAAMAERERIARIIDRWEPYAGVFSRRDLANFIRRGEDL